MTQAQKTDLSGPDYKKSLGVVMIGVKKYLLFVVIIMMLGFCGCSIEIKEENVDEMYSRSDTKDMCESVTIGKGRNDDIYVALDYIYSNELIQAEHGSDFEISSSDIVCHKSEGESCFFLWLYKGQAEYSFTIEDSTYIVKLSKDLFGTWKVTECISE